MALAVNDSIGGGRRRGRARRARRAALSEINVTPLVDVMLVLLIIFMISAPLLTVGVPLQLPKTEAGAMQDQTEPLTVSVKADGAIFLNETPVPFENFSATLRDMSGQGFSRPIYVRADGRAPYAIVAQVMASLSSSGFSSINLITDTGGPSSGAPQGGAVKPVGPQGPAGGAGQP
ncbi:ExbD/TolR family protein [Caulobacter sp. KR2-114]|uniref:ExbD/TolR family protein n=1 Tax=Caulobacter sp. KR2-114 TaxID=3400912 RepID=UPI003C08D449